MFVSENRTMQGIADELNRLGVPFIDGREWKRMGVRGVLTNPKYTGSSVYNRRRSRLSSQVKTNAEAEWIVGPGAVAAINDEATFAAGQQRLRNGPYDRW